MAALSPQDTITKANLVALFATIKTATGLSVDTSDGNAPTFQADLIGRLIGFTAKILNVPAALVNPQAAADAPAIASVTVRYNLNGQPVGANPLLQLVQSA